MDLPALKGALLLFDVTGQEHGVSTAFGPKDPIVANVAVLDGEHKGEEYGGAFVFPGVLISQLKPSIGRKVLGRLSTGQAKPGQKPPWKLEPATADDEKIGVRYLEYKRKQEISAPAPQPATTQVSDALEDDAPPF